MFEPAFRAMARWSEKTPVPLLGPEEEAWATTSAFYDFWFVFKSWREFPHEDEEDTDQAEGREHKRWMERVNAKLREKAKKEEAKRVRAFVEAAYKVGGRGGEGGQSCEGGGRAGEGGGTGR